jgi:hypothetical protein
VGGVAALGMTEEGQRGLFPLGRPRGVHMGAPWLGVRASRQPVRPIARVRWCGTAGSRSGGMQSKGEKWRRRKKREADAWVPHVSERKEKGRGNRRVGLRC